MSRADGEHPISWNVSCHASPPPGHEDMGDFNDDTMTLSDPREASAFIQMNSQMGFGPQQLADQIQAVMDNPQDAFSAGAGAMGYVAMDLHEEIVLVPLPGSKFWGIDAKVTITPVYASQALAGVSAPDDLGGFGWDL